MAYDWIKMRTDLYRDPKVCLIADTLMDKDSEIARYVNQHCQCDMAVTRNVMRNVTVGALVSVWGVMRHRGKRIGDDLHVKRCTDAVVDDIADLPGFGAAMTAAGWLVESVDGIVFPNFFEDMNVDPQDEIKKKNAERQRRYREKKRDEIAENECVDRNVTVTSPLRYSSSLLFSNSTLKNNNKNGVASVPEPGDDSDLADDVKPFFATGEEAGPYWQDSRHINAGRRPLRKYNLVWISPPELRAAFERFEAAGLPKGKYKLVFQKVHQRLVDKRTAGEQIERLGAVGWLTGWALSDVLKELRQECDLERSATYLANAGAK